MDFYDFALLLDFYVYLLSVYSYLNLYLLVHVHVIMMAHAYIPRYFLLLTRYIKQGMHTYI